MVLLGALLLAQDPDAIGLSSLVPGTVLKVEGKSLVLREEGKEPLPIKKPDALRDKVRIASGTAALEYVRLLRTPGVWPFLFDKPVVEIRRQPVLFPAPRSVYDDLRIYTISGWEGVVTDRDWKRLDFAEPKVEGGEGKDWSIRRPCLIREGDKYRVGTLVERVSENGRYVFHIDRPDDAPKGVRWTITMGTKR